MPENPNEVAEELIVTSDEHVRARCEATGAIAALPKRALDYGHIPGWVEVSGPVPTEHKPAAFPPKSSGVKPGETADRSSATKKEK